jgi:phenylalanine-4-hydroxylase
VRKIPLTVDCVETSYDITEPQPQLFVTPDMGHLDRVLEDLEKTMAFVRGGEAGLDRAKRAKSVNTVVLDSGLEISGELTEYALGAGRQPVFLKFTGPVQLSHAGAQISGHGRARHGQGFSTPLGRWAATTRQPQNTLSDADLAKAGLIAGRTATLKFPSGITVSGTLAGWHRENHRLLFFTWRNCTVTQGDRTLFDPSWGEFDMAIGETVTSVYGGPADRFQFGVLDIGEATTSPARTTPYSTREISLFDVYRQIRGIRENGKDSAGLESLARRIASDFADEWLLAVEVLEIGQSRFGAKKPAWLGDLEKSLRETQRHADRTTAELIEKGLALLGQPD